MPGLKDHDPIIIENFGGLWARGDSESAPSDHFIQADNIQYFSSGFETRPPLDTYGQAPFPEGIHRMYDYVTQTGSSILYLTTGGKIWHLANLTTLHGPILTIPAMEDFGFVAIAGRAYITPFKTYPDANGINHELGLQNEFLYVYAGDGTPARKAAGLPPITATAMTATDDVAGNTDIGDHLLAVVFETKSGYLTALGPLQPPAPGGLPNFTKHTFTGVNKILVSNIPIGNADVVKRHLVSTKQILNYNGDQKGYQFFFLPGGEIPNNTATTHVIQFFDSDLLSDASHLIDNFSEIPAGVALTTYHSRLVIVGEYGTPTGTTVMGRAHGKTGAVVLATATDNRSVARLSMPGEPEAISKVDGLIIAPLDGNPLTNCQEFRDVLYLYKKTRTYAYSDNRDEPASWQEEVIDQGVGSPVHGIGTVLNTGGVNIDFLLIADWSGLMLFNGVYARPELTWKIEDFWASLDRNAFRQIFVCNDSLSKKIWITLPVAGRHVLLHADYGEGLDPKNIKWAKWIFDGEVHCMCLYETNKLMIGLGADNVTSGIYFINPKKIVYSDAYYPNVQLKIPDPTVRTAMFGE